MKQPNCLSRALDQWSEDKEHYRLWYNSNHVICLEEDYEGSDLTMMRREGMLKYSPLKDYGFEYFFNAFDLSSEKEYRNLLIEYLNL